MAKAFYPGSFDPAHNGHIDVTRRASRLFDQVIVGVYKAPPKNLMFDTEERVALFDGQALLCSSTLTSKASANLTEN